MASVETYANNYTTTLSGAITSGAVSLIVANTAGAPLAPQFRLIIDSELLLATSLNGATFTVTRGIEGTAAVPHANGAAVSQVLTSGGLVGVAGSIIGTDIYANRPGAGGTAGLLYLPSDGYALCREDGTTWASWGPLYPFTEPVSGNFTWFNQISNSVTGTVTTNQGGIVVKAPKQAGGEAPRIQDLALPSGTWTYTAALITSGFPSNFWGAGLILRDSVSLKNIQYKFGFSTSLTLAVTYYSNTTTFNSFITDVNTAAAANLTVANVGGYPLFLQIVQDGSNWHFNYAWDGQHYIEFCKVAKNTNVTPDRVGFFANSIEVNHDCFITLLSWTGP